jgi:hypothetical protein
LSNDLPHTTNEEPVMPNEETAVHAPAGTEPEALASEPIADGESYAPIAGDDWAHEPGELPPRPRRRLLGVGANVGQIALLGVLLLACGFIGGVLVEKSQSNSGTSGTASAVSRFAALRNSAAAAGVPTTSGASAGAAASGGGGFGGRFAGAAGGATIGEVSYISGSTLYVSSTEGNTVKVTTSAASSVTKTVKTSVHGIHPGETVVVRGAKSASGAVSAESISVSAAGAGGIGALFGGGAGASGGGAGASPGGARAGGSSESALFGK